MESTQLIHRQKKSKHHIWMTLILIFAGILGFLVYTSFYNPDLGFSLTGNVIQENFDETGIKISTHVEPPEEMTIKTEIEKLEIKIQETGSLTIGKENFELKKASLILDNFNGKISFNKDEIIELDGKASKVFVDGIPISNKDKLEINIQNSKYSFLKLNNFYLDSLSYITSGRIKLNNEKAIINIDNEEFKIKKFRGTLEINSQELRLNGYADESNLGTIDVRSNQKTVVNKNSEETKTS